MAKEKPFNVPDLKKQVGWRMNEQDLKNMRIIMASRQEAVVSNILRDLVAREAATVRRRWQAISDRSTEEADG